MNVAAELLLLKEKALTVPADKGARDRRKLVVSIEISHCGNLAVVSFDTDMSLLLVEFSKNV